MITRHTSLLFSLLLAAGPALAQANAKDELIGRILKLQQPAIESLAQSLAEQPAAQMLEQAGAALPGRVPAERREAVARDIRADARTYAEEVAPIVREKAVQLAPSTVGPILREKFTEDELRQIVAVLESSAWSKFEQLGGDMQKALGETLVAETRPAVQAKLAVLEQSVSRRLGIAPAAADNKASAASAPKPAARASAPAKAASR